MILNKYFFTLKLINKCIVKKVLKIRILFKIYIIKYIKHFYSIPHMKLLIPNVKWNMTYFLHHLTRLKSFDVKYVTF